jgi:hypothetical protein
MRCGICGAEEGTAGCTQAWRHLTSLGPIPVAPEPTDALLAAVEIARLTAALAASEAARKAAEEERDEALKILAVSVRADRLSEANASLQRKDEALREAIKALGECLSELEAAIRKLSDEGLVPQAINYRNRERWAGLVKALAAPDEGRRRRES